MPVPVIKASSLRDLKNRVNIHDVVVRVVALKKAAFAVVNPQVFRGDYQASIGNFMSPGEPTYMITVSCMATLLFLGGWMAPWPAAWGSSLVPTVIFAVGSRGAA